MLSSIRHGHDPTANFPASNSKTDVHPNDHRCVITKPELELACADTRNNRAVWSSSVRHLRGSIDATSLRIVPSTLGMVYAKLSMGTNVSTAPNVGLLACVHSGAQVRLVKCGRVSSLQCMRLVRAPLVVRKNVNIGLARRMKTHVKSRPRQWGRGRTVTCETCSLRTFRRS